MIYISCSCSYIVSLLNIRRKEVHKIERKKRKYRIFHRIKSALLELCEKNNDVVEFQRLKDALNKSSSFTEFLKCANENPY